MSDEPRMAVAYDWLQAWRGGETVLAAVLHLYPHADLFAVVDFLPEALRPRLGGKRARTTFIQNMPGARSHFRWMLPLFPRAIESLDVSRYDVVISISHAVAKGVRTRPDQLHVCYCNTPMRYAWDLRSQYLPEDGLGAGLRGKLAHRMLDRLREWDRRTSDRVTYFIANSGFVRERIARSYGRDAAVIHPPVDTAFYTPGPADTRDGYFLAASHWVPYKRLDVIVDAFARLPDRRLVVASGGPGVEAARRRATPNVRFEGEIPRERLRELMRGAEAFVFAAEEDFGIVPVEAQACGTPVIAFGRGGARETVRPEGMPHPTGVFFDEQAPEALAEAIRRFDRARFDPADCRAQAERFAPAAFDRALSAFVEDRWNEWRRRPR
ncbi:MAG: glycosyltransferase [Burkholderiales bacterium]